MFQRFQIPWSRVLLLLCCCRATSRFKGIPIPWCISKKGITNPDNCGGGPGSRGPVRHLGLLVTVGACCFLFVVLLVHQLIRFVGFCPRTPELAPWYPRVDERHMAVVEAQMQHHMKQELQIFMTQRSMEAGAVRQCFPGRPAMLSEVVEKGSRDVMIPGCPLEAPLSSNNGGALQGSMSCFGQWFQGFLLRCKRWGWSR